MIGDVRPTPSASTGGIGPEVPIPGDLVPTLGSWKRPVVVGHVRPDADCLGAMCAVALTWPGHPAGTASISLPDDSVSQRLAFLVEWAGVPLAGTGEFARADGFVAVDTASHKRCNVPQAIQDTWADRRPIINIDHHASNTDFGRINWVDAQAGSACELIFRLIRAGGLPISPVVASLLYAGIHSDTVGFSLPTTTGPALRAAADLVECGARVSEIGERLCRSQSDSEFDLLRVIYDNTRLLADGRIACSTASYEEITAAGCTAADIDDQVAVPRSLRGIRMAILLTEGAPGKTRGNLRGEGGTNVLALAKELGGGGHTEAAGVVLNASIDQALERIIPLAVKHLDQQPPPLP